MRRPDCLRVLFRVNLKVRLSGSLCMRSFVRCVALMCLLLTFWSALAVVAHHHADGTDSASCTVCVAAHSTAPAQLPTSSRRPSPHSSPSALSQTLRKKLWSFSRSASARPRQSNDQDSHRVKVRFVFREPCP